MIGRPEVMFWRLFGFMAMCVCMVNILVLLNGDHKVREIYEEKYVSSKTTSPLSNSNVNGTSAIGSIVPGIMKGAKEISSIPLKAAAVKNPLWLSVMDLDKYFNPKDTILLGKKRLKKGYLVIGVPTVHRKKAYYLMDTIKWLIQNLPLNNQDDVVIVIFVADFDSTYRKKVIEDIQVNYPSAVSGGLIQVIVAPDEYYPNFDKIPLLYGDKPDRVRWRSKQSLDYSFLYYHCANLGKYYIQLEDDVLTEKGYFDKIHQFIESRKENWSTLEFGARGFIGMTYRSENLISLSKFARFYFWTMPIDWIFRIYNDIFLYGNSRKNVLKPPIFKHIGEFSSLDGQFRKLDDLMKKRGKKEVISHIYQEKQGNPPAIVRTSMQENVEGNAIEDAYGKKGYFWGKNINAGQYVDIILKKAINLKRIVFSSGSPSYPQDSFMDTELFYSKVVDGGRCVNMHSVQKFKNTPLIDYTFEKVAENVACVRLSLLNVRLDDHHRKRWLIIREIALKSS